ncbi:hypothetical protein BDP27DRAFT_1423099 [Rhodocollybia butyracea]|uniref:Small ribosomal subunit protein uS10 domain-containing protein n=1 Tax=Rhodocollybia butyracea TaxID=206335 RepID=A0A9P5PSL1_9AGAR|nr:hypothetical protein BDP27DRAFT_1423099 [Rhodocollybia butyracea]
MYRVKALQRLISAAPQRTWHTRFPHHIQTAAIHNSVPRLHPRKPSGIQETGEQDFDQASIQELIDGGLENIDTEDDFNPDSGPLELANSEHELFGTTDELLPITPLPSGLDPRQLPVKINSTSDLGPDPSEEAYAASLVHGRSIHLPYLHPRTHSIPAGNVTFYSHHPKLLALFTHFAGHAASSLGIPTSKVVPLPTRRRLWTVIRAPFAYKKSQENFERKTYKRMIKAWDADPEVIDRWFRYLEKHSMGGVGIRVTKWERLPLGIGKTRLAHVQQAFKVPNGVSKADMKLLEVQEETDSDATRKQAITALSSKIVKEEMGLDVSGSLAKKSQLKFRENASAAKQKIKNSVAPSSTTKSKPSSQPSSKTADVAKQTSEPKRSSPKPQPAAADVTKRAPEAKRSPSSSSKLPQSSGQQSQNGQEKKGAKPDGKV